ncbi:MAG: endonuclease III domain-containing protein, partial [Rhabdochlamydiaceae bacterium]
VTPLLFQRFPDAKCMARANLRTLEKIINSTGFFHVKAKRIKLVSKKIVEDFNGRVPETIEELTTLSGVGRKTANIVLSAGYDKIEGIAVDTHVKRLSNRIGLSKEKTPERIEQDLMKIAPKEIWPRLSLLLILHGRSVCVAKKPACGRCVLSGGCLYFQNLPK